MSDVESGIPKDQVLESGEDYQLTKPSKVGQWDKDYSHFIHTEHNSDLLPIPENIGNNLE